MSWTAIKNGELPTLGLKYFDAFVTTDRNLSFQKNLASFSIVSSWLRRGQTTSPISGLSYQTFWRSSSPLGAAPPVSLGHLRTKPSRNSSTNIPAHQLPAFTTTGAQYLTARSASDELPTYAADPAPLSEIGRCLSPLGQAGISRRPCYSFKFFGGTVTHNVRGATLASVFTAQ